MFDYVMGYNYKIGLCKNSEHERNQRGFGIDIKYSQMNTKYRKS